ncbi:unnamed protein product, partial [Rotaria sp. Silwood1]
MDTKRFLLLEIHYINYIFIITGQEYDFIVLGIGSAGSIMAARSSEPDNNWSVLALDRGIQRNSVQNDGWDEDLSGVHDPNYFSVAQDYLGRL